jgi:hypothetical protein
VRSTILIQALFAHRSTSHGVAKKIGWDNNNDTRIELSEFQIMHAEQKRACVKSCGQASAMF